MSTKPSVRDPTLANVFGETLVNQALAAEDISDRVTAFQKAATLIRDASFYEDGEKVALGWSDDIDPTGDEVARNNFLPPGLILSTGLRLLVGACKDADVPSVVVSSLFVALVGRLEDQEQSSKVAPGGAAAGGPGDSFGARMQDQAAVQGALCKDLLPELASLCARDVGLYTRGVELLVRLHEHPAMDAAKLVDGCMGVLKVGPDEPPPILWMKLMAQMLLTTGLTVTNALLNRIMPPLVDAMRQDQKDVRKAAVATTAEVYKTARKRVYAFVKELPAKGAVGELEAAFAAIEADAKAASLPPSRQGSRGAPGPAEGGLGASGPSNPSRERQLSSAGTGPAPADPMGAGDRPGESGQVEPTKEMMLASCGQMKRGSGETLEKFWTRVTHLQLDNRKLTRIANLRACTGIRVLYLYDNMINRIENLDFAHELTHLYLQNNLLESCEGLGSLKKLQKLYLDGNRIKLLTGLEGCERLEELYVNKQRLGRSESLQFDLTTMRAISGTLCVLKASGSAVGDHSLHALASCRYLEEIDLSNNRIQTLDTLAPMISDFASLTSMDVRGNPVCKTAKYRNDLIISGSHLRVLDGKDVAPKEREFLLRLMLHKSKGKRATKSAGPSSTVPNGGGLPNNMPPAGRERGSIMGSKRTATAEYVPREVHTENGLGIGLGPAGDM